MICAVEAGMEDSHQQHAATRAVVEPHEYGAGKEPDHHRRAGQVSPPVAAIIKDFSCADRLRPRNALAVDQAKESRSKIIT